MDDSKREYNDDDDRPRREDQEKRVIDFWAMDYPSMVRVCDSPNVHTLRKARSRSRVRGQRHVPVDGATGTRMPPRRDVLWASHIPTQLDMVRLRVARAEKLLEVEGPEEAKDDGFICVQCAELAGYRHKWSVLDAVQLLDPATHTLRCPTCR